MDDPIYALALLYRYAGLAIALYDINPEKCPFELVIHFSNKNVAKRLLENGYDPNTVKLDVPYVSALQEEGFGWGSLAWNSKPILHYAACHGDTDFVRMLLVKGAHIDMPARYQSPGMRFSDDREDLLILLCTKTHTKPPQERLHCKLPAISVCSVVLAAFY